ncbi:MAG TPA: PHP domain-containing protein [Anaerolineales bacterium]|nr:PHP domain-containing protein [Anaerolineales bacterium]
MADIHIHTIYSHDATTTVRGILKQASSVGFNVIAITDHDDIRGAFDARELASEYNLEVIPGVEVTTRDGHLLALFVEKIPRRGLPLDETLKIIGDMGGIAVAPHPFNQLPGSLSMDNVISVLTNPALKNILRGIEVYNMTTQPFDERVQRLSAYLPFSQTAGSDAHVYWAIGTGKTEFRGTTAAEFRTALEQGITIAHPYEKDLMRKYIFNWLRRITMRRLGYVSHAATTEEVVSTQRMDLRFTKSQRAKLKKKNLYTE